MPFGSYEQSKEQAFASCARVMKETGCGAIKLEGGRRMAETIAFLAERGVPVMGHVGLTPQSINTIGSFRAQGRDEADWAPIEADAKAVADAGAFSVVIEAVAEPLGAQDHRAGRDPDHRHRRAAPACDGQILVLEDMLGLSPRVPKFVAPLWRSRAGHRGGDRGLCRGRALARLSGPGARLPDAEERTVRSAGFGRDRLGLSFAGTGFLPCPRHIDRLLAARSGP